MRAPRKTTNLRKNQWLVLREITGKYGVSYEIGFYIPVANQNRYRSVAHDLDKALEVWANVTLNIPDIKDPDERLKWLDQLIIAPPKLAPRRGYDLNFGITNLAKQLSKYCDLVVAKPISRGTKTKIIKLCRDLLKYSGDNSALTNEAVKKYFKSLTNPNNHKSSATILGARGEIKTLAAWLGIKDINGLFADIYFANQSQLVKSGVSLVERNRRHLERNDVLKFIKALVKSKSHVSHNGMYIQLLFGCRPTDATNAEVHEHSIRIPISKTEGSGVEEIVIKRSPVIDACLFLFGYNGPNRVNTKSAAAEFRRLVVASLGTDGAGLDRYCLRHTVLTWSVRCWSIQKVYEMAGHTGPRMIQDFYVSRNVLDLREWKEAMPLYLNGVPEDWHGFIFECLLVAKWPCLLNDETPNDPAYQEAIKIFLRKQGERKRRSLGE